MQICQNKERITGSQAQVWPAQKKIGVLVVDILPKCLPHKYCVDKPCEPGILGQELDIEKGLFFIGK